MFVLAQRVAWAAACVAILLSACITTPAGDPEAEPYQGPIVDAHNQVDQDTDIARVVPLMDEAGVAVTILSTRFRRPSADVAAYARDHPGRIVPAVKTKTKAYMRGRPGFPGVLRRDLAAARYGALPEVILWHAQKGAKAGKAVIRPDDARVAAFLDVARDKGWPFVAHIEFAAAGSDRAPFMAAFEALLAANRDLPVALIHMGQLGPAEAGRLIVAHPNLHFITSHCNPINGARSNQPWTNMFRGQRLSPAWEALVVAHPGRFVLAFDNVFPDHWGRFYLDQVALWRRALGHLPEAAAHAVAHGNAERLWRVGAPPYAGG